MQMYPAYKLADVLNEYAVAFYALLNEGYRMRYEQAILAAQINDLASMEQQDRENFYRNLQFAATHPSDILDTDSEGSSPAEIRKALGG